MNSIKQQFTLQPQLALSVIAGFLAFWSTWQIIAPIQFFWYPLLIVLSLHCNTLTFLATWIFSCFGVWGSMTASLSWIGASEGPYFTPLGLGQTLLLASAMATGIILIVAVNMAVIKYTSTWNSGLWYRISFFPVVMTAFFGLLAKYGPMGEVGSPVESAFAIKDVVVGSLYLGGYSFGNFVMLSLASMVAMLVEKYYFERRQTASVAIVDPMATMESGKKSWETADSTLEPVKKSYPWYRFIRFFTHPYSLPITALLISNITGAILMGYLNKMFYQKEQFSLQPTDTFAFGCMAVQVQTDEYFFSEAEKMVNNGVRFITTSEVGLGMTTVSNESTWLQPYQDFARKHSSYLGIGYMVAPDDNLNINYNRFTMINTTGGIMLKYDKTRPVPFAEDTVIPGTSGPLAFEIDPNLIGNYSTPQAPLRFVVATCFDGEFPSMIREGSLKSRQELGGDPDYFLHPTWLWGSVSTTINQVYPYRAMDSGMTELRCSSGGNSGAWGAQGQTFASYFTDRNTVLTFQVPLIRGTGSLFLLTGDVVGWFCLAATVVMLVMVVVGNTEKGKVLREVKVWGVARLWE